MKTREQIEARLKVVDEILMEFDSPETRDSLIIARFREQYATLNWVLEDEEE